MLLPAAPDGNSPQKPSTKHKPAEPSGPLYLPLNLEYPGLRKVHQNPPVYICENFLTDEEEHSSRLPGPLLQRSKTHAISGAYLSTLLTPIEALLALLIS